MAMIRKRVAKDGKTTYQAVVRVKGRESFSQTFPSHEQAKRWARKAEVEASEDKHFASDQARKHTVAEAIAKYVAEVLPTIRPNPGSNSQLKWWHDRIGGLTLAEVRPELLAQCRDEIANTPYTRSKPGGRRTTLKKGEAPKEYKRTASTVLAYLNALGSVMTACVKKWHWLDDSPLRKIEKPSPNNERNRCLSIEERDALFDACKAIGPDLTDLVTLAIATGARAGELLGLRWSRIDLSDNRAIVGHTKNHEPKCLMLAGPAAEVLKRRKQSRQLEDDRVFVRLDRYEPSGYDEPFGEALEAAKIQDFRFHDLRHTTGSYLAMSGSSTIEIADILGQKTLAMAKRYAHLNDAHRAIVAKRGVDKFFAIAAQPEEHDSDAQASP